MPRDASIERLSLRSLARLKLFSASSQRRLRRSWFPFASSLSYESSPCAATHAAAAKAEAIRIATSEQNATASFNFILQGRRLSDRDDTGTMGINSSCQRII